MTHWKMIWKRIVNAFNLKSRKILVFCFREEKHGPQHGYQNKMADLLFDFWELLIICNHQNEWIY